jgi:sigma-B regulation protein RsbU (phosphoserine phosphatase)
MDLVHLALSSVIIAVSLAALLVAALRRERDDLVLALFGCTFLIIGLRFLTGTSAFHLVVSTHPDLLRSGRSSLMYLNAAFAFALVLCHFGPGWRSSLRWVAWVYLGFTCIAVTASFVSSDPDRLVLPNNILLIAALATIYANAFRRDFRQRPGSTFLAAACVGGIVFFTLQTLRMHDLIALDLTTDWTRGLIFYCTLGVLVAAVRYFFTREKDLAAIRQELKTARGIQASILPRRAPDVRGLALAARYEPMTEVAGDLYDYRAMGESRLGILVADVSGHGVSAALIASMVKVAFQAQADHLEEPARVLEGMNRILGDQLGSQYVTAGYAFLDTEAGQLRYAGAAHPALLILASGESEVVGLTENGLMLGPFPDATYESIRRPLTQGDRIVMTTDGLLEATDGAGRQFGDERLPLLLAASGDLSAEELAGRLVEEVHAWSIGQQDDDLTVVVVDVQATPDLPTSSLSVAPLTSSD